MEQENVKSCPYCDGKITLLIDYKENRENLRFSVFFDSQNSALSFVKDSTDYSHAHEGLGGFLLIYCPMCGKKL